MKRLYVILAAHNILSHASHIKPIYIRMSSGDTWESPTTPEQHSHMVQRILYHLYMTYIRHLYSIEIRNTMFPCLYKPSPRNILTKHIVMFMFCLFQLGINIKNQEFWSSRNEQVLSHVCFHCVFVLGHLVRLLQVLVSGMPLVPQPIHPHSLPPGLCG